MRLAASGLDALVGKLFRDGTCYRIGHAARRKGNDKTDGPFRVISMGYADAKQGNFNVDIRWWVQFWYQLLFCSLSAPVGQGCVPLPGCCYQNLIR